MKIGIITFPGSNCDDDVYDSLMRSGGFELTKLWHKDTPELSDYKLIVLPGGFSYGDYLRCGAMAARSPIMEKVIEFAKRGGLVIGICNGFQILCESGLLPGALARNLSLNFICKDIKVTVETSKTPWTQTIEARSTLNLPIAHGEGRYIISEEDYQELIKNGQVVLTYQDNPNGSTHQIAGLCNKEKNVFGLMPHPERASDLRSKDGLKIWQSLKSFLGQQS
ncbi:MAG: phosphoribosylformylglycinamidine synthase subunit PurQ [Deltaproteobacteria bacterium]|nr:phosphoribosylformylglycinamidine synthase subunit PurQ [Deltaproteobacteria bacterium]